MKGPTWNDLQTASFKDLKKTYKMDDRQFEKSIRNHLDGANATERREFYGKVWDGKRS